MKIVHRASKEAGESNIKDSIVQRTMEVLTPEKIEAMTSDMTVSEKADFLKRIKTFIDYYRVSEQRE